jgi:UDP-N-acetylglucosamine 2-epimerase (non-hydrolysing)
MGYLDFLCLMDHSRIILTDSGGIQEESTALKIPCLTLRENTERPVTITEGTNLLVGTNPDHILKAGIDIIENGQAERKIPALWDGNTAKRIVHILKNLA